MSLGLSRRFRLLIVLSVIAAVLVPAWTSPAAAVTVPRTLAGSVVLTSQRRVALGFAATHVAFTWRGGEGSGIAFRAIGDDGVTRWRRAPEAHDLEEGDRHYSAVLSVPRVTALRWRTVGDVRGAVTLDYLNTLDGPEITVEVPALARAGASTPDIVTRAEWGADESVKKTSGSCQRTFYPLQQLFVHHTAGANFDAHPRATMRAIYWYHTVRRGWCDIAYNFVISPSGTIFEGRWARRYSPWETHSSENRAEQVVAGAHVAGYNSGSAGISLMGNYSQVQVPPEARRSLAELLAWEADRHNLDPMGTHVYRNPETGARRKLPYIAGHRDAGSTDCPGGLLYASLPAVRRDTAAAVGAGKASSMLTFESAARSVSYGDAASFSGSLVDETSAPLAARRITVYALPAGGTWQPAGEATTGLDGMFSFSFAPKRNTRFIAIYAGDGATWGSQSAARGIVVAPDVTLVPDGATPDEAGIYHYPPATTEVSLSGQVIPSHPGRSVTLSIYAVAEDGSESLVARSPVTLDATSTYRYLFRVPVPGTYRAWTRFPADDDHGAGTSAPVTFTIDQ